MSVRLTVNAMPDEVRFLRVGGGSRNNRAGAGGRGDGRFRRVTRGSPDSNWVTYVVDEV